MAWAAVRISDNPPDYDHPFGHGKTENLAALFEALLIVVGGAYIVKEALEGLIEGKDLPDLKVGLLVMFASVMVNIYISRRLFRIGRQTQSPALEADAWHLMTDVYTSAGIFTALLVIEVGEWLNPAWDLSRVDGLSAIIVAFLIIKTGCSLGWQAICNLIDHSLSPQEIALIEDHIREVAPAIHGYQRLRTRRSGPFRIVLVDLLVDGSLTVEKAHELGVKIGRGIKDHFPAVDVTCHFEPVDLARSRTKKKKDALAHESFDALALPQEGQLAHNPQENILGEHQDQPQEESSELKTEKT
jgi:cation diffusion facilitator family transporter